MKKAELKARLAESIAYRCNKHPDHILALLSDSDVKTLQDEIFKLEVRNTVQVIKALGLKNK